MNSRTEPNPMPRRLDGRLGMNWVGKLDAGRADRRSRRQATILLPAAPLPVLGRWRSLRSGSACHRIMWLGKAKIW
jgi:hypothetical protein